MFNKQDTQIFLEKVPALRSPWKVILTITYTFILILICILFFGLIDSLAWYAPIVSQLVMAFIVSVISYLHFKLVDRYRDKYKELAYQYYFYHLMLPYLVAWYALFFHPFFIPGDSLMPFPVALALAFLFGVLFLLTTFHIERAGFKTITHGMDIYTVFPEEGTIVRGEIYGYVRHPLYLSLTLGCFALAFIANNLVAIVTAVLQLIPCVIAGKLEDNELIERTGEEHGNYIQKTSLLFPFRRIISFFKLLFLLKSK